MYVSRPLYLYLTIGFFTLLFSVLKITVMNYTGELREYLKRFIAAMVPSSP
jgi:hypothetical protein